VAVAAEQSTQQDSELRIIFDDEQVQRRIPGRGDHGSEWWTRSGSFRILNDL